LKLVVGLVTDDRVSAVSRTVAMFTGASPLRNRARLLSEDDRRNPGADGFRCLNGL
jgi:hypothetical protein